LIEGAILFCGAHGDAAGTLAPWVLAFGMKEVLLSALINAQRDDVEHTGFGDLANPGDSLFDPKTKRRCSSPAVRAASINCFNSASPVSGVNL
jgi:hypothetical protein